MLVEFGVTKHVRIRKNMKTPEAPLTPNLNSYTPHYTKKHTAGSRQKKKKSFFLHVLIILILVKTSVDQVYVLFNKHCHCSSNL